MFGFYFYKFFQIKYTSIYSQSYVHCVNLRCVSIKITVLNYINLLCYSHGEDITDLSFGLPCFSVTYIVLA